MSDKVVVRFLKAWRGYSADELAGFDEAVADGLKSKGFAEAYKADGEGAKRPKSVAAAAGKVTTGKTAGKSAATTVSPEAASTPPSAVEGADGAGGAATDNTGTGADNNEPAEEKP